MTERERLMKALFGNPERQHLDVKFMVDLSQDVSTEELCGATANALFSIDQGMIDGDDEFAETFKHVDVRELTASL